MKKILLTSIAVAACGVSAFGQGQIFFENSDGSSHVQLNTTSGPFTGSGVVVELFWNSAQSGPATYTLIDTFTSTFTGAGEDGQAPGIFSAGELTIPDSGTQSFYVEGFYTSGATAYSGTTADFTAKANVSSLPAQSTDSGSWSGELVLTPIVPEPATIALGGLGAAALLLFRRKK